MPRIGRAFREAGTVVAVSGAPTIRLAEDKVLTHSWLVSHGFPTVRQAIAEEVLRRPQGWEFPLIAKPRFGSAGKGVDRVHSLEALREASARCPNLIVQEIAAGQEHTVNLYLDRHGLCQCAVPHERLEVRGGEVSKARTVKHRGLMELCKAIVEALPEGYAVFNIQGFVSPTGLIQIIEINARFGGGYPLAHAAGADFPRWLLQDLLGRPSDATFDSWQDDLTMLRYDEAVFVAGERCRAEEPAAARHG